MKRCNSSIHSRSEVGLHLLLFIFCCACSTAPLARSEVSKKIQSAPGEGNLALSERSNLVLSEYSGLPRQLWALVDVGLGFVRIENPSSGGVLAQRNGAVAIQSYHGWNTEKWQVIDAGNGWVKLSLEYGGRLLTNNGNTLTLAESSGADNQKWRLIDTNDAYQIQSAVGNLVLTGHNDCALNEYTSLGTQGWQPTDVGSGFVKIVNSFTGNVLVQRNGLLAAEVFRGWDTQQWNVVDAGGGYVALKLQYNGKALTNSNGQAVLSDYTGLDSQKWKLVSAQDADEMKVLREKRFNSIVGIGYDLEDPIIQGILSNLDAEVASFLANMNTASSRTYIWPDLQNGLNSGADCHNTYLRLLKMALAYRRDGSSYKNNSSLAQTVEDAMEWIHANWYNDILPPGETELCSWGSSQWYNSQIACPGDLADLTILLEGRLSTMQRDKFGRTIQIHVSDPTTRTGSATNQLETGANLAWTAFNAALQGTIQDDPVRLLEGVNAVNSLYALHSVGLVPGVDVGQNDGFYPDGTFIQHNNFSQEGSYGIYLIGSMASMVALTDGTIYEISASNRLALQEFFLTSIAPTIFEGNLMAPFRGRTIARQIAADYDLGLSAMATAMGLAVNDTSEIAATIKSDVKHWLTSFAPFDLEEKSTSPTRYQRLHDLRNDEEISGTTVYGFFPRYTGGRAIWRREDFAFVLSLSSRRIGLYETTQVGSTWAENPRAWYVAAGSTMLYDRDHLQYSGYFWPTVDAYRIPGTTVDTRTLAEELVPWLAHDFSDSDYSGMVAGNSMDYGAAAMIWTDALQAGSDLVAKKSWFFFDDEMVCLGSGIAAPGGGRKAETIIDNRKLGNGGTNTFIVDGSTQAATMPWSYTWSNPSWAFLAGANGGSDLAYIFIDNNPVTAKRETRSGSWTDINNQAYTYDAGRAYGTEAYLTFWQEHTVFPAAYGYAVVPGLSAIQAAAYAANPEFVIVKQTETVHAVREVTKDLFAAAFFSANGPETAGMVKAHSPCLVFCELAQDQSQLAVSVSDPNHSTSNTVRLELNWKRSGNVSIPPGVTIVADDPLTIDVNTAAVNSNELGKTTTSVFAVTSSESPWNWKHLKCRLDEPAGYLTSDQGSTMTFATSVGNGWGFDWELEPSNEPGWYWIKNRLDGNYLRKGLNSSMVTCEPLESAADGFKWKMEADGDWNNIFCKLNYPYSYLRKQFQSSQVIAATLTTSWGFDWQFE